MTRFANECCFKMQAMFKELDFSLGPGTADLSMRFGLHSGAVTGGVSYLILAWVGLAQSFLTPRCSVFDYILGDSTGCQRSE